MVCVLSIMVFFTLPLGVIGMLFSVTVSLPGHYAIFNIYLLGRSIGDNSGIHFLIP